MQIRTNSFVDNHGMAEIAWLKPASELRPRAKYQYLAESSAEDTDGEVS